MFRRRNSKPSRQLSAEPPGPAGDCKPPRPRRWVGLGAAGVLGACLLAGPAQGAPTKSTALTATVTVSAQFKSVSLSSSSETFGNCSGGSSTASTLGFPNGGCVTPVFTLTNSGTVPEGIDMQAGSMIPSDNGTPWALVDGSQGSSQGVDQYALGNINQVWLSPGPTLDPAAGAALQPNATASDNLHLAGPTASTDASPSFSTSVLYTAF
jgi:hypothetical protein